MFATYSLGIHTLLSANVLCFSDERFFYYSFSPSVLYWLVWSGRALVGKMWCHIASAHQSEGSNFLNHSSVAVLQLSFKTSSYAIKMVHMVHHYKELKLIMMISLSQWWHKLVIQSALSVLQRRSYRQLNDSSSINCVTSQSLFVFFKNKIVKNSTISTSNLLKLFTIVHLLLLAGW